jgi:hypothetical protein
MKEQLMEALEASQTKLNLERQLRAQQGHRVCAGPFVAIALVLMWRVSARR